MGPASDALAPAHRWHTTGGGSARTGATLTAPIAAPVEIAWTHDAGGEIEGEPLVWDEWVLISVRQGPDLRVLRALDLLDGEPRFVDHVVRSREPLEPSIWRDRVAFRAGPAVLAVLELSERRFEQVWTLRAEGPVGPPLLVGSAITATVDGSLTRFSLGSTKPVWEQTGQFRGRISLAGQPGAEQVFAVDYDSAGRAFVARHDWATGTARGRRYVGHHGGDLPPASATPAVHLLGAGMFAHFETPLAILSEREVRVLGLGAAPQADPTVLVPLPGSIELSTAPAAWGPSWIGPIRSQEGAPLLGLKEDPTARELRVLASSTSNPDFITGELPVTVAHGVGFVGARAFDLETSRVLWRLPIEATQRTVLARETALVVDAGRELVAIRRTPASGAIQVESEPPERVEQGQLVLRDGSIVLGDFAIDTRTRTVTATGPTGRGSWPLEELLLLEDAAQRALLGRDVVRGARVLAERDLGRAYLALAGDARASNDAELLAELMQRAWDHGVSGRELDAARRTLEVLRARPATLRRTLSDELRARAERLGHLMTEALWSRAQALGSDRTSPWQLEFLRATLEQDPAHGPAAAQVIALLPEVLQRRASSSRTPREWLAYLEATRRTPVRLVRAPASEADARTDSERALVRARAEWRADLLGFESEHLLILTSLDRPGALARCLALGELVCEALESVLPSRGGEGSVPPRPKLLLHLFETQAEYLEHSNPGSGEAGAGLDWTAGHYSPTRNISSIFVPPGADAFEQVMETYAHELTHHWLAVRGTVESWEAAVQQPGYWIVEGFACLVDEFEFDLVRGEWRTHAPLSRRQDLVVSAGSEQLLAWEELFSLSHATFAGLDLEGHPAVSSRCFLGKQQVVSGRHLFYAQAASACRFLFESSDPRLRQALLAYVEAYYSGEREGLDIERASGMTADELGRRVSGHAREALDMAPH